MEGITEPVGLDVEAIAIKTAYAVLTKNRGHVEMDDLVSEAWVWMLSHEKKMDEYRALEERNLAAWRLGRDLWTCLDKYARKERAATLGYDPIDEQYYTAGMIAMILPHVLAGDMAPPNSGVRIGRSGRDPAEGGDWLAMYIDVASAWEDTKLSEREKEMTLLLYSGDRSSEAVGSILSVSPVTVVRTTDRALRKLSACLGGPRSGNCPYDCECHESRLNIRPGVRGANSGVNQLLG